VIGEVIRGRIGFAGCSCPTTSPWRRWPGPHGDARCGRARGRLRPRAALFGRAGRDGGDCVGAASIGPEARERLERAVAWAPRG
jgi:hypothetical protein